MFKHRSDSDFPYVCNEFLIPSHHWQQLITGIFFDYYILSSPPEPVTIFRLRVFALHLQNDFDVWLVSALELFWSV